MGRDGKGHDSGGLDLRVTVLQKKIARVVCAVLMAGCVAAGRCLSVTTDLCACGSAKASCLHNHCATVLWHHDAMVITIGRHQAT